MTEGTRTGTGAEAGPAIGSESGRPRLRSCFGSCSGAGSVPVASSQASRMRWRRCQAVRCGRWFRFFIDLRLLARPLRRDQVLVLFIEL